MHDLLNIWQIYFDERSRKNCYPEFNHYDNSKTLTKFFENSVIVDLIYRQEHKKAKYFGVFSHDIRKDLVFKNKDTGAQFTPNELKRAIENDQHIEVFGFQRRRKQENIILQAENYHPGFIKMMEKILKETGFCEMPHKIDHIILFNYFIATADVYQAYVTELLLPAMQVLETMPEAMERTNYRKLDTATIGRFSEAFGKPYYPYHPFLLERLPSVFMQKYKPSFKHIF